jgi:hypothetical protein
MDLVRSGGALLSNFFSPLISALADAKLLLVGLMLLIGKSLIAKVFPFFDGMGAKLDAFSARMGKFKTKMHELNKSIVKKSAGSTLMALRDNDIKETSSILKKMGVEGGTLGGKFFAKAIAKEGSVGAALLGKNVIANIRKSITAGRKDIMQFGPTQPGATATTAGMAGQSLADMDRLSKSMDQLVGSVKQVAQATKGTMSVEAVSLFGKVGKSVATAAASAADLGKGFIDGARGAKQLNREFGSLKVAKGIFRSLTPGIAAVAEGAGTASNELKLMIASMSGSQKAGHLLSATLQGLSRALGMVVGFMSALMMVKWIAGEFMGLSKAFSKAHDSLDGLNNSLDETLDILSKGPRKARNLGSDLAESISGKEFKANLAEGIFTALDEATTSLDLGNLDSAWVGGWLDSIFEVFGAGIQSKLQASISKGLIGLAGGSTKKEFSRMLETLDIEGTLAAQFERSKQDNIVEKSILAMSGAVAGAASIAAAAFAPVTLTVLAISSIIFGAVNSWDALTASMVNSRREAQGVVDTLTQVNQGVLSPELALEQLEDRFDTLGLTRAELIQTYVNLSEASKTFAAQTKKEETALKGLGQAIDNLLSARKSFSSSMVKGGDLKDYAVSFKATLTDLNSKVIDFAGKYQSLFSRGVLDSTSVPKKSLDSWEAMKDQVDTITKEIAKTKMNVRDLSPEEIQKKVKDLEERRLGINAKLHKEQGSFYELEVKTIRSMLAAKQENSKLSSKALDNLATEAYLTKLMGGNAIKQYELELTLATRNEALALKKQQLDKFGTSALRERAQIEVQLLANEKEKLQTRLGQIDVSKAEMDNLKAQIDNIDQKMALAGRTAEAWNKHLHKVAGTTYLLSKRFKDMQADGASGSVFEGFKMDEVNTSWNAFNNSLSDTFAEEQKLLKITDDIKQKFGELTSEGLVENFAQTFKKAFPEEEYFKNTFKWIKLSQTAIGKNITKQTEVLNEENANIQLEKDHWGEMEDMLESRKRLAKYERDMAGEIHDDARATLLLKQLEADIMKTQWALTTAKFEESMAAFADAISTISDSFQSAVSTAVSDKIMGRESDTDWRTTLAEGFASGAGDLVGNLVQSATFGNSGLLAGTMDFFGADSKVIDALFPKTEAEKLEATLGSLRQEAIARRLVLERIAANTKVTATTNADGSTNFKALDAEYDAMNKRMQIGKYAPTVGGPLDADVAGTLAGEETGFFSRLWEGFKSFFTSTEEGVNLRNMGVKGVSIEKLDELAQVGKLLVEDFNQVTAPVTDKLVVGGDTAQTQALEKIEKTEASSGEKLNFIEKGIDWLGAYFKKHESPNSVATFDEQANKKLASLKDIRESPHKDGRMSPWKKGMTDIEKNAAIRKGNADITNKAWSQAYEGRGNHLGSAKTGQPFSSKSPYPSNSITQSKMDFSKYGRKPMTQGQLFPQQDLQWGKAAEKKSSWWNKGRSATEGTQKWFGKKGLLADDLAKLSKTNDAFARNITKGVDAIKGWRPLKAFTPKMLATGPTPAVRQAFERLTPILLKLSVWLEALKPGELADGTLKGANPGYLEQGVQGPKTEHQTKMEEAWLGYTTKMDTLLLNTTKTELEKRAEAAQADAKAKGGGKGLAVVIKNPEAITAAQGQAGSGSSLFPDGEGGYPANASTAAAFNTNEGSEQTAMLAEQGMGNDNTNTNYSVDAARSIGSATNSVLQTGFKDIIYNGKLDTAKLALSFVQQVGNSIISGMASGAASALMKGVGSANGNILKGGFQAFANGGIVNKPTLGLIGEGRHNEAIVPLPDGRAIPVVGAAGSTENNITVNVNISDSGTESTQQSSTGGSTNNAGKIGRMVSQAVQAELVEQQRPGGLLNR